MIEKSSLRGTNMFSMKRMLIVFCMINFIAFIFLAWAEEKHDTATPAQVSQEQKSPQQNEKSSTPAKEQVNLEKSENEGEPITRSQSPRKKIPVFWILLPER